MHRRLHLLLVAALGVVSGLIGPTGAAAQPAVYLLDPEHSFVHFEVLHFGTATLRGRFGPLEGVAGLDRAARRGEVSLTIPTRIVSTGLPPRLSSGTSTRAHCPAW